MTQHPSPPLENINISTEQKAQLNWLCKTLGLTDEKEAIVRSISIMVALKKNITPDSQLFLHTPQGQIRLLIPELEPTPAQNWQYLVQRPHPWRRQLYIKGRKLLASTIWQDMMLNQMSPAEAADNWSLPIEAIYEVLNYCQTNQQLLELEAEEERYRLQEKGVSLEPTTAS